MGYIKTQTGKSPTGSHLKNPSIPAHRPCNRKSGAIPPTTYNLQLTTYNLQLISKICFKTFPKKHSNGCFPRQSRTGVRSFPSILHVRNPKNTISQMPGWHWIYRYCSILKTSNCSYGWWNFRKINPNFPYTNCFGTPPI
jgi:hypothetical protein